MWNTLFKKYAYTREWTLTADNEHDGSEEAHDAHALDHHHNVGICGGVGEHRHYEAWHEEREAQVSEDE